MDESMYDRQAVRPMHEELNTVNVRSLLNADEVDQAMQQEGSVLVVVNSVCGCAAGNARPGVTRALQHSKIPDELTTVFAGVDRSAVERARSYMKNIPPSSPCIAMFKKGDLVHVLERRHIERMTEVDVANNLIQAFDEHCEKQGPSVEKDVYDQLQYQKQCGSQVPPNTPMGLS